MRIVIIALLMANASPAMADPYKSYQRLALTEWATERCGYKPDKERVIHSGRGQIASK